jgi:glutathione S-transferase
MSAGAKLTLYGSSISGNCLKGKWAADLFGIAYDWVEIDILAGESRTDDFLAINPNGQVPVLQVASEGALDQSNAILIYLAEMAGSDLIPADALARAQMMAWLFWEQYNHEASIAVRRFRKAYLGLPDEEIDPQLLTKGYAALQRMETALDGQSWICGVNMTLADIALVAYTRVAHEGGFDLARFPRVVGWIARTETELKIPHAREGL